MLLHLQDLRLQEIPIDAKGMHSIRPPGGLQQLSRFFMEECNHDRLFLHAFLSSVVSSLVFRSVRRKG